MAAAFGEHTARSPAFTVNSAGSWSMTTTPFYADNIGPMSPVLKFS